MLSTRYVAWLERHARAIAVAAAVLLGASVYGVAFHLPLRADFSYLLPADAAAVRDFDALAKRLPARDTNLVLVVAPDAESRAAAARDVLAALARIDRDLVERVESDDADTRAFISAHRWLYVPVDDLRAARDGIAKRMNPLYVDLDDDTTAMDKLHAATAKLARSAFVSADGKTQVIVIRTAFRATDVDRDHRLEAQLDAIAAYIQATHPGVRVGLAGGVTVTVAEQRALVRGVALSSVITAVLVAVVLLVHLRSVRLLAMLTLNIAFATLVAFGVAALTVGHLNAATAFLGAIIAGNGVNYGILLVARYGEERGSPRAAMAAAIAGTLRPTLVASLGAAIAYGALGATRFRGFADFALIGGIGMLLCWGSSFVVLPVMMMRFARPAAPSPLFGRAVTAAFGFRRPRVVCAVTAIVLAASAAIAWRYVTHDPYEYDMTQLRSSGDDSATARAWMKRCDDTFGRGLAGLASATYVAVDRREDVPAAVASLRAVHDPIVGPVTSIVDAVPAEQDEKLALAAELRAKIDEAGDALPADVRALRPPDDLREITAADLPEELAVKLRERDGRMGLVVSVRPSDRFDERDGRDLIAFAGAVRSAKVGHASGASLLFADVLLQIQHDGPLVTLVAAIGIVVMVLLVVGRTRRAVAVLVATATGSIVMIAVCALAGLKINFLDFVALPITLGLGVDYAINVADRASRDDARVALSSTGGTVLVCSLTTIIGYLSLLASDNLAIRGFGVASLIGEITCVLAALVVVPAVIGSRRCAS